MTSPPAVRSLRVRALELPLEQPVRSAAGVMTSTPLVLLDILSEDGVVGHSYLRTYTSLALRALARLLEDLAPVLVGEHGPAAQLSTSLRGRFRLLGDRGLVGAALAGIDMALWDADAKRAGMPLARGLSAGAASVPAYRPLIAVDPLPACREAAAALASGFTAVKVKVGHGSLGTDLDVASALKEVLGPSGSLMVDYNQSLSLDEALRRGRALEDHGLTWIEEPIDARDLLGCARLTSELSAPINTGENLESAQEIRTSIELKASDLLTLDVMRVGGVSGWQQAARDAGAARVPACSHAFPEFSVHLLAASPTGRWLEYHDYVAPLLVRPLSVSDGRVTVPSEPGVGMEWDEDVLTRLL
jgi:mandelate racemase